MAFNSYVFIILFLPATLILYYLFGKLENKIFSKLLLSISSIIFLGYFNFYYSLIFIASILVNYIICYFIDRKKSSRIFVILGVFFNIIFLAYFKYYNFFISSINTTFETDFVIKNIIIPLGISFYTFQQISFALDTKREENKFPNFLEYFTYISFFPNLISGPIMFSNEIITQIKEKSTYKFNTLNFNEGIILFIIGLAKKVLIADMLSQVVSWGFNDITISNMDSTNAIIVALCYTLQIYFDFSGYSDMAIGVARMFNINLLQNFNSPYKSYTIAEFWKRWHISLTRFLTKYLYISLGGNRKGKVRTYMNIFIVFAISGLWHGSNYTFLVWGIMHGIAMIINKIFSEKIEKINPVVKWFVTFTFVTLAWVIFRADNISQGLSLISRIFDCSFAGINEGISSIFLTDGIKNVLMNYGVMGAQRFLPLLFIIFVMMLVLIPKNIYEKLNEVKKSRVFAIIISIIFVYTLFSLSGITSFIYFKF